MQAWHIYSKTSAAYFNSRWVSFNGSFLRYHICPHGSWHLVRLGIDHNSVELPDPINLIIVMHILKKCSDKCLKYTFPLEWLHSWLPDISVAFSYVVFSSTDYSSTVWRAMFNNSTFTNATNSTNGTESGPGPGPRPPPFPQVDVVGMVFYCLLALLIVVENLPMIIAFYVNRQLRTKANLLLMSLIMANMVTGTISVPLWVYISVTYAFRGLLYDFYIILDVMIIGSSALSMTLMSLERCYALIKPIKHRNIRKSKYFNCYEWMSLNIKQPVARIKNYIYIYKLSAYQLLVLNLSQAQVRYGKSLITWERHFIKDFTRAFVCLNL